MKANFVFLCFFGILGLLPLGCRNGEEQNYPEPPAVDPADLKALVQGNNEFAFDLYKRLSQKEGNIIFSPYSISTALAMTYAGARGETAQQMAKVLHFSLPPDRLHAAFARLIYELHGKGKSNSYELVAANALWAQKGLSFEQDFLQLTRERYRAGLKEVNFAGNAEGARQTINRWVEERTRQKIQNLLGPRDLNSTTRLVLSNAVYFKGKWKLPFPTERTKPTDFETGAGSIVSVPMMNNGYHRYRCYAGKQYYLLELPYQGASLAMVLLVPVKKGALNQVERELTAATIHKALSKMAHHQVLVGLPRFRFKQDIKLGEQLRELAMELPFSLNADFSGISAAERLSISEVIHGGFIDVDEQGTEAAAATAVPMRNSPIEGLTIRADHPFLFFIRDQESGNLLFFGRVEDPR